MATHEGFDLIEKYFPTLDAGQLEAFRRLGELYPEWNERINVISRRDIECLYPRHVLHSLSIARFLGTLPADIELLDLGTGGGFPGIPLAIAYPQCRFLLLDRIAKKLKVASEIASELGLKNVRFQHGDAGECHSKFAYMVSRAVMPLDGLVKIATRNVARRADTGGSMAPGLVCLKGGELDAEIAAAGRPALRIALSDYFREEFFETKELVYVPFS